MNAPNALPGSAALRLLAPDEPPAFTVDRPSAASDFVLACDHASRRIPRSLGTLGLSDAELSTHIGWDIGAERVATLLSGMLDAVLIKQNYSRLVIDCNRPLGAPDSIARQSEWTQVIGNHKVSEADAAARTAEIFVPYHDKLCAILDQRQREGQRSLLIAVHSFTPVYRNTPRPWHLGIMHRHDARIATALFHALRSHGDLCVGDNLPYAIRDGSDYTLPTHGESRGIAHVGLEIRQDLIGDAAGQQAWAARLAQLLTQSAALVADLPMR